MNGIKVLFKMTVGVAWFVSWLVTVTLLATGKRKERA